MIYEIICTDKDLLFYWLPHWEEESQKSIKQAITQSIEELREDIGFVERTLTKAKDKEQRGATYVELVGQLGCLRKEQVGSAPKTALLASYLSYVFQDSPKDGLIHAANLLGSDTDTIGTMAGALLGVIAKNDPPEKVADMEYMVEESERLHRIGEGQRMRSHAYPDMLYWKPSRTQLDVVGQYKERWIVQGLGEARPGEIVARQGGKYPCTWQWFCLEFGQSILVRRRTKPRAFTRDNLQLNITTQGSDANASTSVVQMRKEGVNTHMSKQNELWNKGERTDIRETPDLTVDVATDNSIRSDFQEEVVGRMLMKLAEQEDGIEKSIAFAAIIAKAKRARIKKGMSK